MKWITYIFSLLLILLLISCGKPISDPDIIGKSIGKYSTPRYSPDGKYIAYIYNYQLYIVDRDGNGKKRITGNFFSSRFNAEGLSWVNEKKLAYLEKDSKTSAKPMLSVYTYDIETREKSLIISGLNSSNDISWNPTHSNLVAIIVNTSNDVRYPGVNLPYLVDTNTSEMTLITEVSTEMYYKKLHWSSDGEKLAFVLEGNNLAFVNIITGNFTIYPYDQGSISEIAFMPNTNKFIYRRSPDASNNYHGAMKLGSTNLEEPPIEVTDIDMVSFDWSPDGERIIYTTVGLPGRNELKLFDVPKELAN